MLHSALFQSAHACTMFCFSHFMPCHFPPSGVLDSTTGCIHLLTSLKILCLQAHKQKTKQTHHSVQRPATAVTGTHLNTSASQGPCQPSSCATHGDWWHSRSPQAGRLGALPQHLPTSAPQDMGGTHGKHYCNYDAQRPPQKEVVS